MKAKTKITLGTMFLGTAFFAGVLLSSNNAVLYNLSDTNVEALAKFECITSSGRDTGKCEPLNNGMGDVCVVKEFLERPDCVNSFDI